MEKLGYKIEKFYNKETGELRGYALNKNNTFLQSSEINKKYTLSNLITNYNIINNEPNKFTLIDKQLR